MNGQMESNHPVAFSGIENNFQLNCKQKLLQIKILQGHPWDTSEMGPEVFTRQSSPVD